MNYFGNNYNYLYGSSSNASPYYYNAMTMLPISSTAKAYNQTSSNFADIEINEQQQPEKVAKRKLNDHLIFTRSTPQFYPRGYEQGQISQQVEKDKISTISKIYNTYQKKPNEKKIGNKQYNKSVDKRLFPQQHQEKIINLEEPKKIKSSDIDSFSKSASLNLIQNNLKSNIKSIPTGPLNKREDGGPKTGNIEKLRNPIILKKENSLRNSINSNNNNSNLSALQKQTQRELIQQPQIKSLEKVSIQISNNGLNEPKAIISKPKIPKPQQFIVHQNKAFYQTDTQFNPIQQSHQKKQYTDKMKFKPLSNEKIKIKDSNIDNIDDNRRDQYKQTINSDRLMKLKSEPPINYGKDFEQKPKFVQSDNILQIQPEEADMYDDDFEDDQQLQLQMNQNIEKVQQSRQNQDLEQYRDQNYEQDDDMDQQQYEDDYLLQQNMESNRGGKQNNQINNRNSFEKETKNHHHQQSKGQIKNQQNDQIEDQNLQIPNQQLHTKHKSSFEKQQQQQQSQQQLDSIVQQQQPTNSDNLNTQLEQDTVQQNQLNQQNQEALQQYSKPQEQEIVIPKQVAQEVERISESRPKTSEGGRRRKYRIQQQTQKLECERPINDPRSYDRQEDQQIKIGELINEQQDSQEKEPRMFKLYGKDKVYDDQYQQLQLQKSQFHQSQNEFYQQQRDDLGKAKRSIKSPYNVNQNKQFQQKNNEMSFEKYQKLYKIQKPLAANQYEDIPIDYFPSSASNLSNQQFIFPKNGGSMNSNQESSTANNKIKYSQPGQSIIKEIKQYGNQQCQNCYINEDEEYALEKLDCEVVVDNNEVQKQKEQIQGSQVKKDNFVDQKKEDCKIIIRHNKNENSRKRQQAKTTNVPFRSSLTEDFLNLFAQS